MTLDAASIGQRIVVRHVVGGTGPSGGPAMSDVIGRVRAVDENSVTLERRDGRTQVVVLSDVVTWKPVPDRPLRRRRAADVSADELTRITSLGWPAIESVQLGEWELRTSRRFTGRANSVAVHGDPGVGLDVALDRVLEFYGSHDVPALAQVVVGSAAERDFLDARWTPMAGYHGGAVVQVADLDPAYDTDGAARIAPTADDDWLANYGRVNDPAAARAVLEGPATVGFVSIGSPAVAIGRVVVTGEWAGIACVEVAPDQRRRGLARRVVETSLAWAVERGADKAYLQTMRTNHAALALYEPYGFVDHHDYRYLEPGTTAPAQ
ncbi:GNAT family N-acetyltransferase [Aeromicrobium ginsengisoli]|uniref:GNAT family N-acetyltransferase n=1 Tax=Aeromicrobium ginsengisoli TaxID=363867 RepID=A0A5M4FKH1_9ACTN|nr:GNAT family N-acetyltransferase [Aeromicrobium ginsengisoli]KAA1400233.1 GNAT family N-acetyltransferase [Aeromicrobium ginsengisoli]